MEKRLKLTFFFTLAMLFLSASGSAAAVEFGIPLRCEVETIGGYVHDQTPSRLVQMEKIFDFRLVPIEKVVDLVEGEFWKKQIVLDALRTSIALPDHQDGFDMLYRDEISYKTALFVHGQQPEQFNLGRIFLRITLLDPTDVTAWQPCEEYERYTVCRGENELFRFVPASMRFAYAHIGEWDLNRGGGEIPMESELMFGHCAPYYD